MNECVICLENCEDNQGILMLSICGNVNHSVCGDCLLQLIKTKICCPLDRISVESNIFVVHQDQSTTCMDQMQFLQDLLEEKIRELFTIFRNKTNNQYESVLRISATKGENEHEIRLNKDLIDSFYNLNEFVDLNKYFYRYGYYASQISAVRQFELLRYLSDDYENFILNNSIGTTLSTIIQQYPLIDDANLQDLNLIFVDRFVEELILLQSFIENLIKANQHVDIIEILDNYCTKFQSFVDWFTSYSHRIFAFKLANLFKYESRLITKYDKMNKQLQQSIMVLNTGKLFIKVFQQFKSEFQPRTHPIDYQLKNIAWVVDNLTFRKFNFVPLDHFLFTINKYYEKLNTRLLFKYRTDKQ